MGMLKDSMGMDKMAEMPGVTPPTGGMIGGESATPPMPSPALGAAAPTPPSPMAGGMPQDGAPQGENPNIPEGEWVERLSVAAEGMLTDETTGLKLMQVLTGSNPPEEFAELTTIVITKLDEMLNSSVPEEAILPASFNILKTVIEINDAARGSETPQDVMQESANQLVQKLVEAFGTTPDQVQEAGAKVQAMPGGQAPPEQPQPQGGMPSAMPQPGGM